MKDLKEEILKGFATLKIDCSEFEHCLEDSNKTYSTIPKSIETENYNISMELEECLLWSASDYNEFESLEITLLKVIDINGKDIDIEFITDDEILNVINY